jgi:site-specific recombinase XerD
MDRFVFDGHALPFAAWPEQDRHAWLAAQSAADDLLAEERPAARWRASSRALHCRCYGIWLAWLASEGLLDAGLPPEQRATKARLVAYLRVERARGNGARTLVNHAVGLRHMFEALAPQQDWRWLLPMIGKLKAVVKPTKNHSDLPSIQELFELGIAMMQHVLNDDRGFPKQRAILFRNGLAIALLAARPLMRRNNLAGIRIGKNLVANGSGFLLWFSGDEMKGRTRRGGPVPNALTPYIQRYLDLHRPILLGEENAATDLFFISTMGKGIDPHALSHEIGKATFFCLGRRVTVHKFRHAAASSIAREDPDHVGIVPSILGHADYATSEGYYIFADETAAYRRFEDVIERLMRDGIDGDLNRADR